MTNKCIIGLCVYNNQWGLPFCLANINAIKHLFNELVIIAYCDKSKDNSLSILKSFKQTSHIHVDILKNYKPKHRERVVNICRARNHILKKIKKNYIDYEFFAFMDTNDYSCVGDIVPSTLQMVLSRKAEWDSISFDREAGYYDFWALSFDPFIYSFYHFESYQSVVEQMRHAFHLLLNQYKQHHPNKFIAVFSAFNGFCLYKTQKFINCTYDTTIQPHLFDDTILQKQINICQQPILKNKKYDCEHRKFHLEAIKKNNARNMICTDFLIKKFPNPPAVRGSDFL
tara:strand:+ start:388 stop:1242 length:855 start_codon:yes stop_codon:yes gene_type:complete